MYCCVLLTKATFQAGVLQDTVGLIMRGMLDQIKEWSAADHAVLPL